MDQNDLQQTNDTNLTNGAADTAFVPPSGFSTPPAGFSDSDIPSSPVADDTGVLPTLPAAPNNDATDTSVAQPSDADDLLNIKQDALAKLAPLVEHLEQTPEEKFRTTMMLIQATDDETKIKDAYAAAQAITDKKAQAQAFLDVVNEINYFTQQKQG